MKGIADISRELLIKYVYDSKQIDYIPDGIKDSYQMSGGWVLFVMEEGKLFKYRK